MHANDLQHKIEGGIQIRKLSVEEMQILVETFTAHANACSAIMEIPAPPGTTEILSFFLRFSPALIVQSC
jgi:hypothetical protein